MKSRSRKLFHEDSYERHETHMQRCAQGGDRSDFAATWFRADTVDAWRHDRMYRCLDPLIEHYSQGKWLTIGDGRFGNDAHYILEKGSEALATDISPVLLSEAKEKGYIKAYRQENAESLSFADECFDFVLCKESYHHFPRPMVALYEMLRVARKGVALIEPRDRTFAAGFLEFNARFFMKTLRRILGKEIHSGHGFEKVGNYVYSVSLRELQKVALGMNLASIAFKGLNDCYMEGVEYEPASDNSRLFRQVKRSITFQDIKCRLGLQQHSFLVAIIFKEHIDSDLIKNMMRCGFKYELFPENPYI